jgi:hypothetical protein
VELLLPLLPATDDAAGSGTAKHDDDTSSRSPSPAAGKRSRGKAE